MVKGARLGHTLAVALSACHGDLATKLASSRAFPEHSQLCSLLAQEHCFSRTKFDPGHFTASGFVLSPDGDSLLLVLHKKLGLWLQPGGHLEEGDMTYVEGARRELREETGLAELELLDSLFDVDIHTIPAFGETPLHRHFDLRALFRAHDLELGGSDEVLAAEWFPLAHIIDSPSALGRGAGTDASVVRVVTTLLNSPDERRTSASHAGGKR